ncbi:MAG: M23 family metallopeptidase [Phenylobacterium sp.]
MRLASLAILGLIAVGAPAAAAPQGPKLAFPLACVIGKTCEVQNYVDRDPGPGVKDYRCGHRTYEGHTGVDLRIADMAAQRRGVDVLAAAAGRVVRLRDGVTDISIRAPGAPPVTGQECGNAVVIDHGDGWETQYCHLARGSIRVKVRDSVAAGAPIARVGLSGATEFPHLHLTVRHGGAIVDPFAADPAQAGACGARLTSLWDPGALRQMGYRAGAVLNAGFAGGPLTMENIEAGAIPPPSATSAYVVAYVRAIGLEAGDEIELVLSGPGGGVLATDRQKPLDRDKAQYFSLVGRKRPPAGWSHGTYSGLYRVHRNGAVTIERRFAAVL